jgi:hypothetical protein
VETKTCSKCAEEKPLSGFYTQKTREGAEYTRPDCKDCRRAAIKAYQRKNDYASSYTNCPECGGKKARYSPRCRKCSAPKADDRGYLWGKNRAGYIRSTNRPDGKEVLQHRVIFEEFLGRPLKNSENIHHINGVRDDNRLENLELWSTAQPSGQRVDDKIAWCIEFLASYGYQVSNPIEE